ncbi:MAG: mechanosensitive ion channel domain-containing protein [Bacteroidota bacterium]
MLDQINSAFENLAGNFSLTNLLYIVLALVVARVVLWLFAKLLRRMGKKGRIPMDDGRRLALVQIAKYFLYVITVIIVLTNLGLDLNLLIASSAALFVGIGLAMQHTFDDVVSGIIILFEGTIEVGDMIYVDSLKLEGTVKEIRLRSTVLETLDSVSVIVPNSSFTSTNVVNWNFNDKETRFRLQVGVAYGTNIQLVRKTMKGVAETHGLVLKTPEPKVRFLDFGDSALIFELLFWVASTQDFEEIKSDLRFMIESDFRKAEIQIPFPQRDLHVVSDFRHKPKLQELAEEGALQEGKNVLVKKKNEA